jgi:predicted RNA binding protein YcfA (HicA-like mRNA interferase family)
MARVPVLKPHEVVARLNALGFSEVRQRGSHKQSSTLTVAKQQSPFIVAATSRRRCSDKSRGILA